MPIGLNYTHQTTAQGILLPSYAYIINNYHPIMWGKLFDGDEHETKKFNHYLEKGYLQEVLHTEDADKYFDAKWIREILCEASPYEIDLKYLQKDIPNDTIRNDRLLTYFNHFFDINYHEELKKYKAHRDTSGYEKSQDVETVTYTDRVGTVFSYLSFVDQLLRSQGYDAEADWHNHFADQYLRVKYTEGISGVTTQQGNLVIIEVGNDTYTTLFHELVHFTNRFFRYHYYENNEVCFDHYTRTNEGLANFVAHHLHESIVEENINKIETISTESLFFSVYIDMYATLLEEGKNDRKHNFQIIEHELHKFYGDLLTKRKTDFYYQRFYKFFHYDQHEYFYPKEMMYHIGYHEIREMFAVNTNKTQLLAQCLLGKVCL